MCMQANRSGLIKYCPSGGAHTGNTQRHYCNASVQTGRLASEGNTSKLTASRTKAGLNTCNKLE